MSSAAPSPAVQRRRGIKAGNDPTDLRRRRTDTTISLRKQKKEQGIAKRRNTAAAAGAAVSATETTADAGVASESGSAGEPGSNPTRPVGASDVPELTQGLGSTNAAARVEAARGLRKVLSLESDPPVEAVINAGAMPLLVQCLDQHENGDLQFEAAWALTNIASTQRTAAVVDGGAVPGLVRNLRHHSPDLREQCAWCLGNIAGDCAELRNVVLATPDALNGLLLNVTQPATESLLRNCVWALSNMCRGKPQPAMDTLSAALPVLHALLSCMDKEVLVDTCWALSYLSDGDSSRITSVMSAGVVAPLTTLLQHDDSNVVTPALRTLGNFVTGDDVQTQAVLDAGVLPYLEVLLRHTKKNIRKETCWTLSNIVAGTPAQMAVVCDAPGIVPGVIEQLGSGVWEVQKEANYVVSNIATASNASRVRQLVNRGAIHALCQMLDKADAKVIMVALDALSCILGYDDAEAGLPWSQLVDEASGLDRLEQLQEHENSKVYEKAVQIIERFFGCEDEEDEELAPTVAEGGSAFTFGLMTTSAAATTTPSKSPSGCGREMQGTPSGGGAATGTMPAFGSPVRTLNFA